MYMKIACTDERIKKKRKEESEFEFFVGQFMYTYNTDVTSYSDTFYYQEYYSHHRCFQSSQI